MSRLLCFFICLPFSFLISNCSSSDSNQNLITLESSINVYGGALNDKGLSVINTLDGGYAVLGYTQSSDGDVSNKLNDSFDYWLLKFDSNNSLQWNKTYGGFEDDRGNRLIQTTDGGYALIGFSKSNDGDVSNNNGQNDFWLVKLDTNASLIWEKTFGFGGADSGISMIQTNDGGYLLTGILDVTASGGQGNSKSLARKHAGGDYWVIKVNANGTKEWSKFYGGTFTDTPNDLIQTLDNDYIIVGSSDSNDIDITNNKGSYDFWVVRIDGNGTIVWERSFGGSETDEAYAISKSGDGNFLIIGDTSSSDKDVSNNNGAADLWVIKMSPNGELLWEKTYGGSNFDVGRSIRSTPDGNFIISGSSRSLDGDINSNNGQNDAWVLKIDSNGNLLWQQTLGGSEIEFAHGAIQLNNRRIIAVGESRSEDGDVPLNNGFQDLLVIKIDE